MPRPSWNDYFLGLAKLISAKSPDAQTKHGCLISGPNQEILGTGYNGFPRGMKEDDKLPTTRPEKYPWMIHSEANAVCSTLMTRLEDATAYVTGLPCVGCLMIMHQKGVKRVIYGGGYGWSKDEQEGDVRAEFLRQSGMIIEEVKPDLQWVVDMVLNDDDMRAKVIRSLFSNSDWSDEMAGDVFKASTSLFDTTKAPVLFI